MARLACGAARTFQYKKDIMTTLKLSRIILIVAYLFTILIAGLVLYNYYNYLCKTEAMRFREKKRQFQEQIYIKLQKNWNTRIEKLLAQAEKKMSAASGKISKALKNIESDGKEINHAIFIDADTIYLSQWKKRRFPEKLENIHLTVFENPDFKLAELLEYRDLNFTEAVKIYENHWLENPADFAAANALARCLLKMKNYARAIKVYQHIITQNPTAQKTDDTPLAIIAIFKLLQHYQQQKQDEARKLLGYQLYKDLVYDKWELSQVKRKLFKKMTSDMLKPYTSDPAFSAKLRKLQQQESRIAGLKNYILVMTKRVIPLIEGSLIENYKVYFLSHSQKQTSFLLIVPRPKGYLVLDIHYALFVQTHFLPFLKSLAQDYQLGIKLKYAGQEQTAQPEGKEFSSPLLISQYFPDLKVALGMSRKGEVKLKTKLAQIKKYFFLGYVIFAAILLLLIWIMIKQIRLTELKSDFVSHVSHEIKTPITAVRILSEMLDEQPRLKLGLRRQYYAAMLKESVRLSRLIENLLAISRIERNKNQFCFQKENMNEVLKNAVEVFQHSLKRVPSHLILELNSNIEVLLDKETITQIVINILDNARKFSAPDSLIKVSSSYTDKYVMVVFQDQGVGMTRSEIRKAFNKFYQSRKKYTENFKGVGLGLAIVRNIVRAHKGKIYLTSEKNKGTTVCLIFPHGKIINRPAKSRPES